MIYRVENLFLRIRNGMNIKQEMDAGGVPITRIETIANAEINLERVGYAGLTMEQASNYLLEDGEILFSHINSVSHIGKCALYTKNMGELVHGMNLLSFKPNQTLLFPKYALYALRSKQFKDQLAKSIKKAVNQASVSIGDIKNITLDVPPLAEQQRIAAILDKAAEIKAKREQAIAKLDELAQSTFVEMFGNVVTNDKGWDVAAIGDLPLFIADGNYSSKYPTASEFVESGVPFVRANNLKQLTVIEKDLRFISPEKHKELAKGHLKYKDVLVITRGEIGKVGLVPKNFENANINAQLVLMRCTNNQLQPEYLCHLFNNRTFSKYIENFQTGAALKQLPVGNLKKIKIPRPSVSMQENFATFIKAIEIQTIAMRDSNLVTGKLAESLQRQAFTTGFNA